MSLVRNLQEALEYGVKLSEDYARQDNEMFNLRHHLLQYSNRNIKLEEQLIHESSKIQALIGALCLKGCPLYYGKSLGDAHCSSCEEEDKLRAQCWNLWLEKEVPFYKSHMK